MPGSRGTQEETMRNLLVNGCIAVALSVPLFVVPVYGAGDGGSGGEATTQNCTGGKIWDKAQQKCVPPQNSKLDLETIYESGRALAKAGRYGEAIMVLSAIADSGDPRVLNYLGYSHRKQGRIDVGLGYYQEALRANPDFTLAREYLGEAYLQKGDLASALDQLQEIEKRCGTGCEEYVDLRRQIDDFRNKG
jgi:tetratricopeptide (TPR) repeat protein